MKILFALMFMSLTLAASAEPTDVWLENARKTLALTFPNYEVEDVRRAEIPGLIEVYAGGRIVYFAPDQDLLVMGEIYSANGVPLTQKKITQFAAEKAAGIDLKEAITVGDGATQVIAFVDPDCGYCKSAHEWFAKQAFKNVSTHTFLMSTLGRISAHARAMQAVCAPKELREEAIRQLYERGSPTGQGELLSCDFGEAHLTAHAEIARKVGVYATPFYLVKTPSATRYEVIAGFDRERLGSLLASTGESQ